MPISPEYLEGSVVGPSIWVNICLSSNSFIWRKQIHHWSGWSKDSSNNLIMHLWIPTFIFVPSPPIAARLSGLLHFLKCKKIPVVISVDWLYFVQNGLYNESFSWISTILLFYHSSWIDFDSYFYWSFVESFRPSK